MPVTGSTQNQKPITLAIDVKGIALTEMEAGKLARDVQSSLAYSFGRDLDDLIVEITADGSDDVEDPEGMSPEEFAAKAVEGLEAE